MTLSATLSFKDLTKLAIVHNYKHHSGFSIALQAPQKVPKYLILKGNFLCLKSSESFCDLFFLLRMIALGHIFC